MMTTMIADAAIVCYFVLILSCFLLFLVMVLYLCGKATKKVVLLQQTSLIIEDFLLRWACFR